jgi:hypothetical protein
VGFLESSAARKRCGSSANLENVWSGGKFWPWYLEGEVDESRTPCRDWVGAEDSMRTLAHDWVGAEYSMITLVHAIVGEAGTLGTGVFDHSDQLPDFLCP